MAILAVANRLRDFDSISGAPTDVTTAGAFDPSYVAGAIQFPTSSDALVKNFTAAAGNVTWFRFTVARPGTSGNTSGAPNAVEIRDSSGVVLLSIYKISTTSRFIRFELHGATNVVSGSYETLTNTTQVYTIKIDQTGIGASAEIYLGNAFPVLQETLTVADRQTRGKPASMYFRLFYMSYSDSMTHHLSEVMIADSSLLGSRLVEQAPATVGDLLDFAGAVADLDTDNPATGLVTDTPGQRHTWTSSAYGGPALTLDALVAVLVGSRPTGTPARLSSSFRIGGVNYDHPTESFIVDPSRVIQAWALNPSTAAKWTTAQLSGLQAGLKSVT